MTTFPEQLKPIFSQCSIKNLKRVRSVSGGDINQCYSIEADGHYFLKVNKAGLFPQMFAKEANGLKALNGVPKCQVPEVIDHGEAGDLQYLLMTWIERGNPAVDFWEKFGTALATLHQRTQPTFGFREDNYIGNLYQSNTTKMSWEEFYSEHRIIPLVKRLMDNHSVQASLTKKVESLCSKLNSIFPKEKPALLHGDLWSGNFMIAHDGYPAVYDPAVYYGHREMDLGMTKLFGGFDSEFYESYNNTFPLEKDWQQRTELTQLYPLLVHAVLFGGGYVQQVVSIINRFG